MSSGSTIQHVLAVLSIGNACACYAFVFDLLFLLSTTKAREERSAISRGPAYTTVLILATVPTTAAGLFLMLYPSRSCRPKLTTPPRADPKINFESVTLPENPVSNINGPRMPTDRRMINPTQSPEFSNFSLSLSRFLLLFGRHTAGNSSGEKLVAFSGNAHTVSASSSVIIPNFLRTGSSTPSLKLFPMKYVQTSLITTPK
mmetsp:Transcript_15969/g.34718  ORF Transcript_15969/g.34718 Transcript_15969/m.34718 type:complete len:202 (+) Transcript_15969:62-667(+)